MPNEIELNAARPNDAWEKAVPISFCTDWRGLAPDSSLHTQVQALWSPQTLFLRFECHYRELWVFEDAEPNGRRNRLWERDVVEAFLQPEPSQAFFYKEFEISPNGMWIDLDIRPEGLANLQSGLRRSAVVDETNCIWVAEIAVPLRSVTNRFDPACPWRANFYRVEGKKEPRQYLAWQPTHTPEPNFHVPDCFGGLRFG